MDEKIIGVILGSVITLVVGGLTMYFTRKNLRLQLDNQTENLKLQLKHQQEHDLLKIRLSKLEEILRALSNYYVQNNLILSTVMTHPMNAETKVQLRQYIERSIERMIDLKALIGMYEPELEDQLNELINAYDIIESLIDEAKGLPEDSESLNRKLLRAFELNDNIKRSISEKAKALTRSNENITTQTEVQLASKK